MYVYWYKCSKSKRVAAYLKWRIITKKRKRCSLRLLCICHNFLPGKIREVQSLASSGSSQKAGLVLSLIEPAGLNIARGTTDSIT